MEPDEIIGANFRIYRPGPGFVRCDPSDRAEVSGQDIREMLEAIAALTDGGSTPVLVDVRKMRSGSREAREEVTRARALSRIALYVESPLSRALASFFIGVARPEVPTKAFTDLDEARKWLLDDE